MKKPSSRKPYRRWLSFLGIGLPFLILGVLITANLDFSTDTTASDALNILQTGAYPVVDRGGEVESPFVQVVEKVQDAVVNISARSRERTDNLPWWHQGPNYSTSSGSGFFFREDGYILTNNHVVEKAVELYVTTASGYRYDAKLVGTDPQTDLAVVKIEPGQEKITTISFGDSDVIKVGDWAIAIGNPFPQQGLDRTVTVGVVSAKGRSNLNFGPETPQFQNYIQTDASINPGNSGGPLLNLKGECIGVNAAISSPTGVSVGIGFAIPINLARAVVPDLIETGRPNRGWLGVWLGNLTEREARRQGLDAVRGVKIDSVFENSPAAKAGIKAGDIIVKINDLEVNNNNQLSVLISQVKGGEPIKLGVIRDGEQITTSTIVADRENFLAGVQEEPGGRSGPDNFPEVLWAGMELITFTPELAQEISVEYVAGVFVQRVVPDSPADRASITRGTIILQVNNQPVKSIEDVEGITKTMSGATERIPLIVVESDGSLARKVIRP